MMMRIAKQWIGALVAGAVIVAAACAGGSGEPPSPERHGEGGMGGMHGAEGAGGMHDMTMDPEMMRRHAEEAAQMAERMRAQVETMSAIGADRQHARMAEHVALVADMLAMMRRHMAHMAHMGAGMGEGHEGHPGMMMSEDERRDMHQEMETLRTEAERLQTATVEEVRELMPAHLDRLEKVAAMMERCARHMSGGHGEHGGHDGH